MTDNARGPAADGVEEGKRLIRVAGERGISLAERLARHFERLAWLTPLPAMRLRGRHPLKLIAVPDDPFLGDLDGGNALLDGVIWHQGEERSLATLDFARPDWSARFDDYLQGFGWLRDLSSVTTRAVGVPIAEAIMQRWLAVHGEKVSEAAWRPEYCGRRLLAWTAHAPLILSSSDLVYRSSLMHALARTARHLDRSWERAPIGAPRLAAAAGVLVAGLVLPGGDARRAAHEAVLRRAIEQSVFDEGGVVSRAPDAQVEAIQLLTLVAETYAARRAELPEFIEATRTRLVSALLGLCHADHGLSSWQGAAPLDAERIGQIVEASGVRTRPLKQSREWGYQRLSAAKTVAILDGAPPPLARLIAGGCASTLAFELSDGPDRIVVNCGGGRAADARMPAALAKALRASAAHSTLVLRDTNSTAIHADGTLGRGVTEVEISRVEADNASRIEASHDGYARRFGFVHRRLLALSHDGRDLRGEDMLLPVGKRRQKGSQPFAARFHLHPGVEATPTADGQAAILRTASGQLWQCRARGGTLAIEESLWIDPDGQPLVSQQLVINGETPPGGATVSWIFHRGK